MTKHNQKSSRGEIKNEQQISPGDSGSASETVGSSSKLAGWGKLSAVIIVAAFLWTVVFPYLSSRPEFQEKLTRRQEQGIELSARFYTELDVQNRHHALENLKKKDPWALWIPWSNQTDDSAENHTK